ncbi:MAG: hypothetical protein SO533_00895 [Eubacteriales bacterium]|nr:hypothetical protein [Eubacteriales bacterium]
MVAEILCHGRENAILGRDLCKTLGFNSLASLQRQIASERIAGKNILSASGKDGNGYFLPSRDLETAAEELSHFVRMMNSRCHRIRQATKAAEAALSDLGQTKIEI